MDFVEVNDEALVLGVLYLYAFAAEDGLAGAAVEVLDPVLMLLTKLVRHNVFILVFEVESTIGQLLVFFHYFIKNVDI